MYKNRDFPAIAVPTGKIRTPGLLNLLAHRPQELGSQARKGGNQIAVDSRHGQTTGRHGIDEIPDDEIPDTENQRTDSDGFQTPR
jgi:hypothetical protein